MVIALYKLAIGDNPSERKPLLPDHRGKKSEWHNVHNHILAETLEMLKTW